MVHFMPARNPPPMQNINLFLLVKARVKRVEAYSLCHALIGVTGNALYNSASSELCFVRHFGNVLGDFDISFK